MFKTDSRVYFWLGNEVIINDKMIISMNPLKEEYLFATYLYVIQRVAGSLTSTLVSRAKGYDGGN